MAILEQSQQQHQIERDEEVEDREWAADREEARRQHEIQLAKVKAAVPQRHKTITRIGLAVAKLPALVVLTVTIPLLILCKREVPSSLTDFMNL